MVKFFLFGSVRAEDQHGKEIIFPTKKVKLLAAWLASEPGKQWNRAQLATRIWPDTYQDSAMASLRQALAQLRKVFSEHVGADAEVIITDRNTVQTNSEFVWSDHAELVSILEMNTEARWQEALELAKGEFLEGEGELATLSHRNSFREKLGGIRRKLFHSALETSDKFEALQVGHKLFQQDPVDSLLTQEVVELASQLQETHLLLQIFEIHRQCLYQRYGLEPHEGLRKFVEEIESVERSEALPQCNFQKLQYEVLGRKKDVAALHELIKPFSQQRAVTLIGPGGIGKTTLARCFGTSVAQEFGGAVWFLDLSAATQVDEVISKIQAVFGYAQTGDFAWISTFSKVLNKRPALLILDNLEQVEIGVHVAITELLSACPSLQILSTSRRLLGLEGEHIYKVKSLLLPQHDWPTQQILDSPSVELYVSRASAVAPTADFRDGAALGELCRKLDGLPLALCLAASKADIFTIQETIDQIETRFQLLESDAGEHETRHKRLWTCIDWSYRLIPDVQRLFAELSVFTGGWTAKSALFVTKDPNVLFNLQSLRRQCLIEEISRGREVRFGMLESIHDFAASKLAEDSPAKDRHLDFFMTILEEAKNKQSFDVQTATYEKIEADLENIRSAFKFCLQKDSERALRAVIGATDYFVALGRQILGLDWLSMAEKSANAYLDDSLRIQYFLARSQLLRTIRREDEGRQSLNICLQLAKSSNVESRIQVISALAAQFLNEGRLKESLDAAQLGMNLCSKKGLMIDKTRFVGTAAIALLMQGNLDESARFANEVLQSAIDRQDLALKSSQLYTLAHIALLKHDLQSASELVQESINALESIGMHAGGFGRRTLLSELEMRKGRWEEGLQLLKRSVMELRQAGMTRDLADCAPRAALWCENHGKSDLAVSYLTFYEPFAKGFTGRSDADWRPTLAAWLQDLRSTVPSSQWRVASKRFFSRDISGMAETILSLDLATN